MWQCRLAPVSLGIQLLPIWLWQTLLSGSQLLSTSLMVPVSTKANVCSMIVDFQSSTQIDFTASSQLFGIQSPSFFRFDGFRLGSWPMADSVSLSRSGCSPENRPNRSRAMSLFSRMLGEFFLFSVST